MESDELRYKEFKRSVRGYSPDEVDDLLDSVADELDGLRAERDRLTGELEEARDRIEQYESLEGSIRATLTQAEKAASEYQEAARRDAEATTEAARREAEVVIHDAEASARRMLADSSAKVERVRGSYEALRETRSSFDADLRRLLQGYLQLLDEANSATVSEIEAPLRERLDPEAIASARAAAEEDRQGERHEEVSRIETRDGGEYQEPEPEAPAGSPEPGTPGSGEVTEEPSEAESPASETASPDEHAGGARRGWFSRRRD